MKKTILSFFIVFALLALVIGGYFYIQSKKNTADISLGDDLSGTPVPSSQDTGFSDQAIVVEPVVKEITLTITSPQNGATVTTSTVTIKGKTVPKADIFINEAETVADANGSFSKSITLDEGDNIIIVMANDAKGNVAEQDLTINYDPGL
jgi:hypothetical protein